MAVLPASLVPEEVFSVITPGFLPEPSSEEDTQAKEHKLEAKLVRVVVRVRGRVHVGV